MQCRLPFQGCMVPDFYRKMLQQSHLVHVAIEGFVAGMGGGWMHSVAVGMV